MISFIVNNFGWYTVFTSCEKIGINLSSSELPKSLKELSNEDLRKLYLFLLEIYSKFPKTCKRCGRGINHPASIKSGIGSTCRKHVGTDDRQLNIFGGN